MPGTHDNSFLSRRTAHNGPLCAASMPHPCVIFTGAERHALGADGTGATKAGRSMSVTQDITLIAVGTATLVDALSPRR